MPSNKSQVINEKTNERRGILLLHLFGFSSLCAPLFISGLIHSVALRQGPGSSTDTTACFALFKSLFYFFQDFFSSSTQLGGGKMFFLVAGVSSLFLV